MGLPDYKHAHERLRWARRQAGFRTMRAVEDASEINYEVIKKDEAGERGFDAERAKTYGRLFHVPWLWLLHGRDADVSQFHLDEIDLIMKYRRKSDAIRRAMHAVADSAPDQHEEAV